MEVFVAVCVPGKALDIEFGILAYFNKNVFIQALFESFLVVFHLKPINLF